MARRAAANVIYLSDHRAVFVALDGRSLVVSLIARGVRRRGSRRKTYALCERAAAMAYAQSLAAECGCDLHDISGLDGEGAANG